ncbi:MAG: Ppx/GppA phosphatase family protein [Planctomycetia bacterium]|nr:Ppx/GppA phosphatase family protein [Planctomycetia bacterium]
MMEEKKSTTETKNLPPKIIAAIDIGTNSIRFAIAEAYPDGKFEMVEQFTQAVWLGKDTFQRGRLSSETMRAGIEILRRFRKLMDQYGVERLRAVATTAIREASNADIFIDRIRMATGIEIEVIDASEEIEYSVAALQETLDEDIQQAGKNVLFVNVGGGSTLLSVLCDKTVVNAQSLNIGAIRLREAYSSPEDTSQNAVVILRHNIQDVLASAETYFPFTGNDYFVAMGGDARFAARQVGHPSQFAGLTEVHLRDFDFFVERVEKMDTQQICREFGIAFQSAETTVPAMLTYQEILRCCRMRSFLVSEVSMRHGLLANLAREVWNLENSYFQKDVLDSAKALAQRFHVDIEHARATMNLAAKIFDNTISEHGLGPRYRLLLQVAAILQNSGKFISNRSFHKHSYYLISNSEIFGLSHNDTEMVAQTARYSFRSPPKPSHLAFLSLPRTSRVIISKLAAILRIADALNRGECPNPERIRFTRVGDDLTLLLPPDDDFLLKCRALETQGKMFEDVFGMRVLFDR